MNLKILAMGMELNAIGRAKMNIRIRRIDWNIGGLDSVKIVTTGMR
jgi:hypothetical protein